MMGSSQDEIFLQEHPQMQITQPQIRFQAALDNQNEYLSQFINSQGSENLQINSNSNFKSEGKVKSEQIKNVTVKQFSEDNKSENSQKSKKRQKSFFHNFQKHLVITLRNIIKMQKGSVKGQIQYVAYQMWDIFVKSTLYSKKFLFVLFGVYGSNDQNEFSKNFLNDLGYMQIFAKYSEDQIRQGQKYLRREVIKQMESINIKGYLMYRKLKRVDQFQQYIRQFIEELKQGSIRKRLPKQRKVNMLPISKQNQTSQSMCP